MKVEVDTNQESFKVILVLLLETKGRMTTDVATWERDLKARGSGREYYEP